ncbi:MAG: Abi family protein [Eggerthellaceae bacterium]|nr:Abi family protein [Eggerthellaceae bacterium]
MIVDKSVLIEHLEDVGYYRLSGYWHIFRNADETLRKDTTFERVWDLYVFDRQLRLVVLDAIERVEIYFRTQLAHMLARDTGQFGYLDNSGLPRLEARHYERFMSRVENAFMRSREPFAIHFREKYGDCHSMPPYWMLVNVIDFGIMLSMYKGASVSIRNELAAKVGVSARVLESWLVSLNTTRNICAHHGRLWNRIAGTVARNCPVIWQAAFAELSAALVA